MRTSREFLSLCAIAIAYAGTVFVDDSRAEGPAFTPTPQSLELGKGRMPLDHRMRILYDTRKAPRAIEESLRPLAEVLAGELEMLTGFAPKVAPSANASPRDGDIHLRFKDPARGFAETEAEEDQSYSLNVKSHTAITSAYYKGVAYGTATLLQAIVQGEITCHLPRLTIRDAPESAYRTVMVDIARRKHSVETLYDVVRMARQYKVRYLQLHLTDDQNFVFPFRPVTEKLKHNYTINRQAWVDLVRFADDRGVTIIPEFELPGHSGKLKESGYLVKSANHREIADPVNNEKVFAIIDDMLSVFASSPYFHIGGDESGAGDALIPMLAAVNAHLRGKPVGEKRRMLVWEGFHGAPAEIPATGDDRVIVLAWESSYNAPWNLLNAGYTIVNACWKPLYIVGRGTPRHPGAATRMWSPEAIHQWDANTFMHWEPGRPVYEDRGPNDQNRSDHEWLASNIGRRDQVCGGQLLLWEQEEQWVIEDLSIRLPVFAERLWNPQQKSYQDFAKKQAEVHQRVMTLTRPVEILPKSLDPSSPASLDYRIYEGDAVQVRMRNRCRIPGTIHYNLGSINNDPQFFYLRSIDNVTPSSMSYSKPFSKQGGFGVRAQLFRANGEPVGGANLQVYNNWPQRVEVTDFDTGPKALNTVPDLAKLNKEQALATYQMPMLRGPYTHIDSRSQMLRAMLNVPATGKYQISAKTQSGRATVYLDLNQDNMWSPDEAIIINTLRSEKRQTKTLSLKKGRYALRVDHATGLPRPVLFVSLEGPDTNGPKDITQFLEPIK